MYIGTQTRCRNDTDIEVLAQLGVFNVDQTPAEPWSEWTVDVFKALRERFDRYGHQRGNDPHPPRVRQRFR